MATAFGFASYLFSGFGLLTPDTPIIDLPSAGKLQGLVATSRGGRQYYQYLGIPYAKPPVNELRFEPPVPPEKWKGVRSAKAYGSPCLQFDAMIYGSIIGEENCLYLNVFTTKISGGKLHPVLVTFHGGGFTSGDSKDFGPSYFMDEDCVVVTVNFRLYVLGFINTGDELIRGNMGFKDQNLALRWVQENIKKFGGDPDKVTLSGSGSGGISVHYHILSPLSKGLFHRAISQSGHVAVPFAFVKDSLSQAQKYGKRINCPTRNTSALVRCLRSKRARELIQVAQDLMSPIHTHDEFFTGTLETIKREDTFLIESPFDILEQGNFNKVPWILGVNSGEGAFKVSRLLAYPEIQSNVGKRWKEYAPIFAHFDPNKTDVSDRLRQYYFGGSRYLNPGYDLENLTQLVSDGVYFHPTHWTAIRHARHSPTFLYFFTYQPVRFPSICSAYRALRPDSWFPAQLKVVGAVVQDAARNYFTRNYPDYQDWTGVCIDQQIPLLWSSDLVSDIWKSSPDYQFSRDLIQTIVNFMDTENQKLKFNGLPWPSISPKGPPVMYMRLDTPPRMIDEPFAKYLPFWDSLSIRSGYDMGNW
ncbi:venom carboxylesterase-6-like [Folsomia candida]|uniref:venom carboxylesterase-6-like n=1 Tax=Folsomia candida TaxID=158441 RepID=UPI0016054BAC|nr:venom carboxylesterase-6-like [Folsomia candida]